MTLKQDAENFNITASCGTPLANRTSQLETPQWIQQHHDLRFSLIFTGLCGVSLSLAPVASGLETDAAKASNAGAGDSAFFPRISSADRIALIRLPRAPTTGESGAGRLALRDALPALGLPGPSCCGGGPGLD